METTGVVTELIGKKVVMKHYNTSGRSGKILAVAAKADFSSLYPRLVLVKFDKWNQGQEWTSVENLYIITEDIR